MKRASTLDIIELLRKEMDEKRDFLKEKLFINTSAKQMVSYAMG